MNEKYISGFGAGLILISFGVIISYLVASGVENRAMETNQTINFEQLEDIHENSYGKLKNSTTAQEFRKFVGETVEEIKEKVALTNSTLYTELKNSNVTNGTK